MSKGTFEGFDVTAQRKRDQLRASAAEDDSIVTGAPRCYTEGDHHGHRGRSRMSPKRDAKPKSKEPLMADLPFFLWIPVSISFSFMFSTYCIFLVSTSLDLLFAMRYGIIQN